jgi:hypothetical protein
MFLCPKLGCGCYSPKLGLSMKSSGRQGASFQPITPVIGTGGLPLTHRTCPS